MLDQKAIIARIEQQQLSWHNTRIEEKAIVRELWKQETWVKGEETKKVVRNNGRAVEESEREIAGKEQQSMEGLG